mmetsp:Transcript_3020/g.7864  ORF Transcript_3020/g.7864 Transcript_3020/m.7864 type:complete len:480 (-) Transcript_3020:1110-2549(-)
MSMRAGGRRTLRFVLHLLVREAACFHRVRSRRRRSNAKLIRGRQSSGENDDRERRSLLSNPLFRFVVILNILSLTFPFAPVFLGTMGMGVYLNYERDHAESTRPFAPSWLIECAFDAAAPLQVADVPLPGWARGGSAERWLVKGERKESVTAGKEEISALKRAKKLRNWFGLGRGRGGKSEKVGATVSSGAVATVYLPGLVLDCLLGVVQGLVLGIDLLFLYLHSASSRQSRKGAPTTDNRGRPLSVLPSLSLLLFAGMCASALPLHCLRDSPLIVEDGQFGGAREVDPLQLTRSKTILLFADVFCTTVAPTLMFLDFRVRTGWLSIGAENLAAAAVPLIKGPLVWVGVSNRYEWWGPVLVAALHVGPLPLYGTLFYGFLLRECDMCPHEALWMATSAVSLVAFSFGPALWGTRLAELTGGTFDSLTCMFLGCRIGMVQYWAYVRARDEVCRRCDNGEEDENEELDRACVEVDKERKRE